LRLNQEDGNMNKLKHEYAHKIQAKRVFNAWRGILGLLRRKRILTESATLMNKNSLLEKTMQTLRGYADKKIQDNMIIDRF
jgi:hypothetical protein